MPQSDIIHNQAIKTLFENRRARPGAALSGSRTSSPNAEPPRMLSYWRPKVQAWRQERKARTAGLTCEWHIDHKLAS